MPRFSTRKRASEEPPGNGPRPLRRMSSRMRQLTPPDSGISPESELGHRPVRACQASAQARICGGVTPVGRRREWPRCSLKKTKSDEWQGSPRVPVWSGALDGVPGFTRGFGNRAVLPMWPSAMTGEERFRPRQDLWESQRRRRLGMACAAVLGKELSERAAAGETTPSYGQSGIHCEPGFLGCVNDLTGLAGWPFPGAISMSVGPRQNLLRREWGVPENAALFYKEAKKRGATGVRAAAAYEEVSHGMPVHSTRVGNLA